MDRKHGPKLILQALRGLVAAWIPQVVSRGGGGRKGEGDMGEQQGLKFIRLHFRKKRQCGSFMDEVGFFPFCSWAILSGLPLPLGDTEQ